MAIPPGAIVVTEASVRSADPTAIVDANIDFLNALLAEYLTLEEMSVAALYSCDVDYYLAQVNNGGFSQFVYNSRWDPQRIARVRTGLQLIQAPRHLALFEEGARQVERLGPRRLVVYLGGTYFSHGTRLSAPPGIKARLTALAVIGGRAVAGLAPVRLAAGLLSRYSSVTKTRTALDYITTRIYALNAEENLMELNAAWLRAHLALVVLSEEQIRAEVQRRAQAVPDRAQRIAAARAREPRTTKLIRALCAQYGCEFSHETAGDPTRRHEGVSTIAWHFITDQGHFHMVEVAGQALMFRGHSTTDIVARITAPPV